MTTDKAFVLCMIAIMVGSLLAAYIYDNDMRYWRQQPVAERCFSCTGR